MNYVIDFIKGLIAKEPARLIAWGSALAVTGAVALANALGVTLSDEILLGVSGLAALIITELIRRFVYSPDTTQAIADHAAATGDTDIGTPPEGP